MMMSDNELLLAISDMLDRKLKPIHTDVRELQEDMSEVKGDIAELKADVRELQEDMSEVKADIAELQVTVGNVQIGMKKIQIQAETDFSPRLQNIESCYLSTYQRYSKGTEQIDSMQLDIDVLKSTVIEHSEKLQRIS
ncbi:MAG: hypothetical protein K2K63_09850 [Acetatifactor sp.]|nr:hypothetical protein [Acetatifactor sp.]